MCTRDSLPIDAGAVDVTIDGGQNPAFSIVGMSAGSKHTCVVLDEGKTQCWGDNRLGQLDGVPNNSTVGDYNTRQSTVDVPSGVSSGAGSTCVFSDDRIECFGDNSFMQLGGGIQNRTNTLLMELGKEITSSACSLTSAAEVNCWGGNTHGQTSGDGNGSMSFSDPVQVIADGASAIALGESHTCAIVEEEVHCWGDNNFSQIARNADVAPQPNSIVALLVSPEVLDAGNNHTCITDFEGGVHCWGDNTDKQSNPASVSTLLPTVTALENGVPATALALGKSHSCLLGDDERVYCWGDNRYGQRGVPSNTPVSIPVVNLVNVVAISAGQNHTCALVDGDDPTLNGVYCWGQNDRNQLFGSEADFTSVPVLAYPNE